MSKALNNRNSFCSKGCGSKSLYGQDITNTAIGGTTGENTIIQVITTDAGTRSTDTGGGAADDQDPVFNSVTTDELTVTNQAIVSTLCVDFLKVDENLRFDNDTISSTTTDIIITPAVGNKLIINSDVDINGTLTRFLTTDTVLQDPVISLGFISGTSITPDSSDRGLDFTWVEESSPSVFEQRLGFIGYDKDRDRFVAFKRASEIGTDNFARESTNGTDFTNHFDWDIVYTKNIKNPDFDINTSDPNDKNLTIESTNVLRMFSNRTEHSVINQYDLQVGDLSVETTNGNETHIIDNNFILTTSGNTASTMTFNNSSFETRSFGNMKMISTNGNVDITSTISNVGIIAGNEFNVTSVSGQQFQTVVGDINLTANDASGGLGRINILAPNNTITIQSEDLLTLKSTTGPFRLEGSGTNQIKIADGELGIELDNNRASAFTIYSNDALSTPCIKIDTLVDQITITKPLCLETTLLKFPLAIDFQISKELARSFAIKDDVTPTPNEYIIFNTDCIGIEFMQDIFFSKSQIGRKIFIRDSTANSLIIKDSTTEYMIFDTASKKIFFNQSIELNQQTNIDLTFAPNIEDALVLNDVYGRYLTFHSTIGNERVTINKKFEINTKTIDTSSQDTNFVIKDSSPDSLGFIDSTDIYFKIDTNNKILRFGKNIDFTISNDPKIFIRSNNTKALTILDDGSGVQNEFLVLDSSTALNKFIVKQSFRLESPFIDISNQTTEMDIIDGQNLAFVIKQNTNSYLIFNTATGRVELRQDLDMSNRITQFIINDDAPTALTISDSNANSYMGFDTDANVIRIDKNIHLNNLSDTTGNLNGVTIIIPDNKEDALVFKDSSSGKEYLTFDTLNNLFKIQQELTLDTDTFNLEEKPFTIKLRNNESESLIFKEGTINYLTFDTTSPGKIKIGKDLDTSSQNTKIIILDNSISALTITDAINSYIVFDSFTKTIKFNQNFDFTGRDIGNQGMEMLIRDSKLESLVIKDSVDEYMIFNTSNNRIEILKELKINNGTPLISGIINIVTQPTDIKIIENNKSALEIKEGANCYMRFDTTDNEEKIVVCKNLDVSNQNTSIFIADNSTNSFIIQESGNKYMTFDTTDGKERIIFNKDIIVTGGNIGGVSLGPFTSSTIDDITIDGNTISVVAGVDLNLSPAGGHTVIVTTDFEVGYLNIDGRIISSTDVNGDINLSPNGSGLVIIKDLMKFGNPNADTNKILLTDNIDKALAIESEDGLVYMKFSTINGYERTIINQISIIDNVTGSTSKDTGAFIVEGGVGIEQNLYAGGLINATGTIQTNSGFIAGGISPLISTFSNNNLTINTGTGFAIIPNIGVTGGTIDGTLIGGTTPSIGNFTNANFTNASFTNASFTNASFGGASINNIFMDNSTISTVNTNSDLFIKPNGIGRVIIPIELNVDTINESTGNNGVVIEQIILRDNCIIGGQLDIDNIRINGNTINTININGNIELNPNGVGKIILKKDTEIGKLLLDPDQSSATITTKSGSNSNLILTTNGIGDVQFPKNIRVDEINELTFANGVLVEGVKLSSNVASASRINGGNIGMWNNEIISANTGGDINLSPNGIGFVVINNKLKFGSTSPGLNKLVVIDNLTDALSIEDASGASYLSIRSSSLIKSVVIKKQLDISNAIIDCTSQDTNIIFSSASSTFSIKDNGTGNDYITCVSTGTKNVLLQQITRVTNTANSIGSTTGALLVDGGLGVAKNIYAAGVINSGNSIQIDGPNHRISSLDNHNITLDPGVGKIIIANTSTGLDSGNIRIAGNSISSTTGDIILSPFTGNVIIDGNIALSELTIDNVNINNGVIAFNAANRNNSINIIDDSNDAFSIKEGDNPYLTFTTTNGNESVQFLKDINTATNPRLFIIKANVSGSLIFKDDYFVPNSYFEFDTTATGRKIICYQDIDFSPKTNNIITKANEAFALSIIDNLATKYLTINTKNAPNILFHQDIHSTTKSIDFIIKSNEKSALSFKDNSGFPITYLTFDSTSGNQKINLFQNLNSSSIPLSLTTITGNSSAFTIKDATSNKYIDIDTTIGNQSVRLHQNLDASFQQFQLKIVKDNVSGFTIIDSNASPRTFMTFDTTASGLIKFHQNLDVSTQETYINIIPNVTNALDIKDSSNKYLTINTLVPSVRFFQDLYTIDNATNFIIKSNETSSLVFKDNALTTQSYMTFDTTPGNGKVKFHQDLDVSSTNINLIVKINEASAFVIKDTAYNNYLTIDTITPSIKFHQNLDVTANPSILKIKRDNNASFIINDNNVIPTKYLTIDTTVGFEFIKFHQDIDITAQATLIKLIDNNANALEINDTSNNYIKIDSQTPTIYFGQDLNTATKPFNIIIKDNDGASFVFKDTSAIGTYITFDSTTGGKNIKFHQNLDTSAGAINLTTINNDSSALLIRDTASNNYITIDSIASDPVVRLHQNLVTSSQLFEMIILNNNASSFIIKDNSVNYMNFDTTTGLQKIKFLQDLDFASQDTDINIRVNSASALVFKDTIFEYITFNSITLSPTIILQQNTIINATTASTSKDTGALIVKGGVGIEQNLNVGNNIIASGTIQSGNSIVINGITHVISTTLNNDLTFDTGIGSVIIPNININGGKLDNINIGATLAGSGRFTAMQCENIQIDNILIDGNIISSTDLNGDINLTPNGTGHVILKDILKFNSVESGNNTIIINDSLSIECNDGPQFITFNTDVSGKTIIIKQTLDINAPLIDLTSQATAIEFATTSSLTIKDTVDNFIICDSTGTKEIELVKVTKISDMTPSTSATTGALIVAGGLGVSDNIYASGAIQSGNSIIIDGTAHTITTTLNNDLTFNTGSGGVIIPNGEFSGNSFFYDAIDNTKIARFELNNLTTGTTTNLIIPNIGAGNVSLVGLNTTQILTNKTLTLPLISNSTLTNTYNIKPSNIISNIDIILPLLNTTDTIVFQDFAQILANKKFPDLTTFFVDNLDNTKVVQFKLSNQTSATTTNLIIPNIGGGDLTIVGTDSIQILTNKILTFPKIIDLNLSHNYNIVPSDITTDINITLPVLLVDDTFVFRNMIETLKNKTFPDLQTYFVDNLDNTKIMQFELATITAGTITKITVPNGDFTLVGLNNTQILTNKTLTLPKIRDFDLSHTYTIFPSNITSDVNTILPILTVDDTFLFQNLAQTLINKTFPDLTTFFVDDIDDTKVMQFKLTNLSPSTTTTINIPNIGTAGGSIHLVGRDLIQTLKNKTHVLPKIDDSNSSNTYTIVPSDLSVDIGIILPVLSVNDTFLFENLAQILSNKTIDILKIYDSNNTHTYTFGVNNLTSNITLNLPLLTTNDTFIFKDFSQILKNKSFVDDSTFFIDNFDNNKRMVFEIAGVSSGSTRVITIPNFDLTLVGVNATQSFTNKTIDLAFNTLLGLSTADIGLGNVENIKNNYLAVIDPQITNDLSQEYGIGSTWINNVSDEIFICTDTTTGVAIWKTVVQNTNGYNIGTAGIAIFKQKNIENLEFKKINAASIKISIVDDIINDKIDIDIVEENININNLSGIPIGSFVGATDIQTITNKTFIDATTTFVDDIDTSKKMLFQLSNIAFSTTRTITVPNLDITLTGINAMQTLTNKTINSANNTIIITKTDIGLSNVENTKVNFSGIIDPTLNDDSTLGYSIGSIWVNTESNISFILTDNTNASAIWKDITQQASIGETNTVSNIGIDGIGLFKQKVISDFEFKNINIGSNKVILTDDILNNEINIDIDESKITIGNLIGAPTSTIVGLTDVQTLTNKSFVDNSTFIIDDIDATKRIKFELAGILTGTTRIITIPDANVTLVDTDLTQTLSNKTIDADNNIITNINNANIKATAAIDATKIADGSVSNTRFQRINALDSAAVGVSDIQVLTNKTVTDLQINDTSSNNQYIIGVSEITSNITTTLPLLLTNDIFVFQNFNQTLANKSLIDALTFIIDDGDNTKRMKFELSALTSGNTRTITMPNFDLSPVDLTAIQTLTNKTIDASSNTLTNLGDSNIIDFAAIDATKIANGIVTNVEFQFLNGVLSSVVGISDIQILTNKTFGNNINMSNNRVINVDNPINPQDVVTKFYVDSLTSNVKDSVLVGTTYDLNYNLSISGTIIYNDTGSSGLRGEIQATLARSDEFVIDTVILGSLDNGRRILVKDQLNPDENGIYILTISGGTLNELLLERSSDFDTDNQVTSGNIIFINSGFANKNTGWILQTLNPITIGGSTGTELDFIQFTGAGQITAGDGLSKIGDIIFAGGSDTIISSGNSLQVNSSTTEFQVLVSSGISNIPSTFGKLSLNEGAAVSGILPIVYGGTGKDGTDFVANRLLATSGSSTNIITSDLDPTNLISADGVQTISNKIFKLFTFSDGIDSNKNIRFDLSGISPNLLRTYICPDQDTIIAGTDIAQTFTLKSFGDSINMLNNNIINLNDPNNNQDAATKIYVDEVAGGRDAKNSARASTNDDLNNNSSINGSIIYNINSGPTSRGQIVVTTLLNPSEFILDDVIIAFGDRILIKDQINLFENGIWTVSTLSGVNLVLDRADDFDEDNKVNSASYLFIEEGTYGAATGWLLNIPDPITIGGLYGSDIIFTQFTGVGSLTAGFGLLRIGNAHGVGTSATIKTNSDSVEVNSSEITNQVLLSSGTIGDAATYGGLPLDDLNATTGILPVARGGTGIGDTGVPLTQNRIVATANTPSAPLITTNLIPSELVTSSVTITLTNKTIDADDNTLSNITNAGIKVGAAIDASKIADGSVSNIEYQFLNGVSSALVSIADSQTLTNKIINGDNNILQNISNSSIKVGAAIDSSKIADGSVSNSEFQHLDGLTSTVVGISDVQNLTNKSINGDNNTITNITNDGIKTGASIDALKIANGTVSNSEFQFLNGVTSTLIGASDVVILTNKSMIDANTFIINQSNNTKKIRFEVGNVTASTTRILTIPNDNGTIALLDSTQTFSNKIFSNNTIFQDWTDHQGSFSRDISATDITNPFSDANISITNTNASILAAQQIVTAGRIYTNKGIFAGGVTAHNHFSGITHILNNSTSINATTGALQVIGGMGITENLNIGGAATIIGNASIGRNINDNSGLDVYGLEVYKDQAPVSIIVHNNARSRGGIAAIDKDKVAFLTTSQNNDLLFGYSTSVKESDFDTNFQEIMKIDNGLPQVSLSNSSRFLINDSYFRRDYTFTSSVSLPNYTQFLFLGEITRDSTVKLYIHQHGTSEGRPIEVHIQSIIGSDAPFISLYLGDNTVETAVDGKKVLFYHKEGTFTSSDTSYLLWIKIYEETTVDEVYVNLEVHGRNGSRTTGHTLWNDTIDPGSGQIEFTDNVGIVSKGGVGIGSYDVGGIGSIKFISLNGPLSRSVAVETTTSVVLNDTHYLVEFSNPGIVNVTLPLASSLPGIEYILVKTSSTGKINIISSATDTINNNIDQLYQLSGQYQKIKLINNSINRWYII
jgi:hypothetical protein